MGRLPTADDLGFNHPSAGLAIVKQPESGLAEGLQTLGRTIAAIGARDRAEQEQLSKYKLKSDLEAFHWDQKIAYQQVVDTSAEDGSDIWARREAELQKVKKDWDKRPMSPEERAMVDDVFNGVTGQQRFAAYEDARTKRLAWQEKDIKWGADRTLSQGIPDQKTFDSWWNAQVAKIDSSGLPPEIKDKIKSEIATAGALKFGSDNPQGIIGAQKNTVSQFLTQRLVPAVQATENGPRDPRAVSKDGAIGLMQVTLRAAEDVAKKIGDEKFFRMDAAQRTEYLMNPDVNMKYGTAYLGMMLDKYRGDVETALIAYNAGSGNADKWLEAGRDYATLPRRRETEPYVQKVLANLGAAKLASGTAAAPGKARIPIVTGTQPGRQPLDMSGLKPEVIDRWERVQGAFGRSVPIVSAYRDEARNKAAGGAKGSQHLHGNAIDVDVAGMTRAERVRLIETASAMGFTGIGVYANSLHFDTGNRRAWGPSHSFGSVPPWAYTAIAKHVAGKIKQDTSDGAASYAGGSVGGVPDGQENVTFVSNRKPVGGMWDYVSLDDWEKIHKVAAGVAKDNILSTAPDELTGIEINGKFDGKALTADDFNAAYGPEAAEKYADYNTQRSLASQKYEYGSMTEAQIVADLESRKNAIPTGTGIAEASKNYSEMVTAASSVISERYKDPAKYVMDRNPQVRAAWDAFDPKDPTTGKSAIAATIAAQQALGIPANKIMPMPKSAAAMVSEIVKDDVAKPSDRMNMLIATIAQTDDSGQREAILRQLVDAGLTPAIANVAEAWQRGDENAARRLFAAATVDTEKMPKPAGLKEKEFSDAVTEELMGEGTAGYALYGLKYGDPRGQKVAQSDLALAKNAALISMRGGMDQSQAVAQAVRDIMGDVSVVEQEFDGGGAVEGVVPDEVNQNALMSGMAASMERVMLAVQAYNARQTAALPEGTSKETEAIFRARTVMRESDILAEGSFRNYGDGWGFYDPYTNAFVVGPDGNALVFTTEELLRAGADQPEAGTFQTPRTKAIKGIER